MYAKFTQSPALQHAKMRCMVCALLVASIFAVAIVIPDPPAGHFSTNLIAPYGTDLQGFEFYPYHVDALKPPAVGYVISASVTSTTGKAPPGTRDAMDISKYNASVLAKRDIGFFLYLNNVAAAKWGVRTFLLPKSTRASVQVLTLPTGDIFLAAATADNVTTDAYKRTVARYSTSGKLRYYRTYDADASASYAAITLYNTTHALLLADMQQQTKSDIPGSTVLMDYVKLSNGALASSTTLTKRKLGNGLFAVSERALAVIKSNDATLTLLLRTSADKDDRGYALTYELCTTKCTSIPSDASTGNARVAMTDKGTIVFARVLAMGSSERVNVRRIRSNSMETLSETGVEFIPPEQPGSRARSAVEDLVAFPANTPGEARLLISTSGALDERAIPADLRARAATMDVLNNGSIGHSALDARVNVNVRAASLALVQQSGRVDSLILTALPETTRARSGGLRLVVGGDPGAVPSPTQSPLATSSAVTACIGTGTTIYGRAIRNVIYDTSGIRLQRHPLRRRNDPVPVLCLSLDKDERGAGSTLCATPTHVIYVHRRAMYMRDFCLLRPGSCVSRYQMPLNFKAHCRIALPLAAGISISMHSGSSYHASAQHAVDDECELQSRNWPMWFFTTL